MAFTINDLSGYPTVYLMPGNTSYDASVYALQEWLVKNGFLSQAQLNTGPGIYGPQTTAAVTALQEALVATGSLTQAQMNTGPGDYGPLTIGAIQSELAALETPTVTAQTPGQTWTIGQAVNFSLPSNTFTDPQNENLTYTATLAGGAALPSWLSFNGGTGTFSGTIPSTATSLNIKVTATDTSELSASENFAVTVPTAPDSELEPEDISVPTTVAPGASFSVSWLLANTGSGAANSTSTTVVRINQSTSTAGPVNNLAYVSTAALPGNSSVQQVVTVNAPSAPGTYYVWVLADDYSQVTNQSTAAYNVEHSIAFTVTGPSSGDTVDPFISYTDATSDQPVAADVVSAAEEYIGATWEADNCTGLIWAVSVAIGAPFYETIQTATNGQATNASQLTVVPDNGYIVPPTSPEAGSSSDWTTFFSSAWTAQVQVGDLVRIPGTVYLGSTDPGSGHSFIVVGNSDTTNPTDPDTWLVIDNTVQDPSGSTVQISTPHTFDYPGNVFDGDVLSAPSAYISYLSTSGSSEPSLSSVSPTSVAASSSEQTITLYGSNFAGGDSLLFTFPDDTTGPNLNPITVLSSSKIEYTQFDDKSDAGAWQVQVKSPDGTLSNAESFTVKSGGGNPIMGIDTAEDTTLASQASTFYDEGYSFFGAYVGPQRTFNTTEASEIESAHLLIVTLHERTDISQSYSPADANTDAGAAIYYAYQAGQPLNTSSKHSAIYFALELNSGKTPVSDDAAAQYVTQLSADFASASFVSDALGFSTGVNPYDIGVYASNSNLSTVQSLELSNVDYYWQDTNLPNDPQSSVTTFSSPNIERDLNGPSYDTDTATTSLYGQWGATTWNDAISETVPSSPVEAGAETATEISGVSIADAGGAGDTFTTVVSDIAGALTASGGGVSGAGTTSLTITGSLSAVNSALSTLVYGSGGAGSDTVTVTTSDPNASNSPVSESFGVTVNPADVVSETAPASIIASAGQSFDFTGANAVQLTDAGAGSDTFATVVTTVNGGDVSASGTGGAIVSNSGTESLTISGTLSQVNAALGTLSYESAAAGNDTVTVTTSDLANQSSAVASIGVTINAAGPPPATTLYDFQFLYNDDLALSGAGDVYTGTVADDGSLHYYVGEDINTSFGQYQIYADAGSTTEAAGTVNDQNYTDNAGSKQTYTPYLYSTTGHSGNAGLGLATDYDYIDSNGQLYKFGGGIGEAIVELTSITPTLAITNASELPDSATQTLTGTIDAADAGLTISIDDDGAQVGTATANASGAWTATVTLSGDDPHTLTAQATDSAALTGVSNALYLAMAGGETIAFADASGDAASLYGTANDWDSVSGSDGTVYLSSAQATVAGGDDLIEFATGSGNVVSLTGTANNWDWVSGSDGTVYLSGAQSTVAGSGNIVIESGSGDTAFLFDTANDWDTVTGSNGTVDLASAQAFAIGGNNTINFEGASGDAVSLYGTGANWGTTVIGSNGTVYLNDSQALAIGGSDTINFEGASGDAVSLYGTGANWGTTVIGSNGTVYLNDSQALAIGGSDTINFEGASGDAVSLYGTGANWGTTVNGSNGTVYLNDSQALAIGGSDTINFEGASGDAVSLYGTGANWGTTVNGSNGTVYLNDSQALAIGGSDTINFEGPSGDAVSLYDTGANWGTTVNGSNGTVYLNDSQALAIGGGDTINFEGASGDAVSLYDTGANWGTTVNGSNGTVYLNDSQALAIGGGDTINFEGPSGDAVSLYGAGQNGDTVNGSNGTVYLNSAGADLSGSGDAINMFGTSSATQNGASDTFVFQQGIGGQDVINGFAATDNVYLSKLDFADWTALSGDIAPSGANNTVITLNSDTITLTNVKPTSLASSQFHFV